MKSAKELLDSTSTSPIEHKKRATALRRVAGGLKTEIDGAAVSGLSKSDIAALHSASAILHKLATVRIEAAKLAEKRVKERQEREKVAIGAMDGNFNSLSTVADKVCFLIAASPGTFKDIELGNGKDSNYYLNFTFDDQLRWLAYSFACKEGDIATLVRDAWQRFVDKRPEYERRGREVIERLSAAAG